MKQPLLYIFTYLLLVLLPFSLSSQRDVNYSRHSHYAKQSPTEVQNDLELYHSQVVRNRFDFIGERRRQILRTTPFDTMAVRYIEKGFKGVLLDTVSVLDYFDYNRTPYTLQEQWLVLDTLYNAAKRYKSPELSLAADFIKGRLMEQGEERYEWFEQTLQKARKIGEQNMQAHILTEMWARTHYDGWYARSFEYAKRLEDALDASDDDYPYKGLQYIWLAISYHRFKDNEKALHFFHKGLSYRHPSHELFAGNYLRAWDELQNYHLIRGDLDSVACYSRIELESPEGIVNFLGHTNLAIANLGRVEMRKGNYHDAVRLMEAGLENMVRNHGDWILCARIHNTLGECYLCMGELESAKYHISRATADIHRFAEDFRQEIIRDWYALNSKYYSALGEWELSRQYLDSALVAAKTFEDLTGKHIVLLGEQRLQQAELEIREVRLSQQRNIIWFTTTGILLSFVALIVILLLYRRQQAAYKALAAKARAWADSGAALTGPVQPSADVTVNSVGVTDACAGQDKDSDMEIMELGRKLRACMEEYKPYTDPELTLEKLADSLHTSREKLSRAINRNTGKNFKQYVNELRVSETIHLMNGNPSKLLSMDQLMEHAGFSGRTTFFNSFKAVTGLSPAQYWKSIKTGTDS